MQADVQPRWARLLVKGRLLQLQLPCEVLPDSSMAQRSKITGSLALTMPKENPEAAVTDMSLVRRRAGTGAKCAMVHHRWIPQRWHFDRP